MIDLSFARPAQWVGSGIAEQSTYMEGRTSGGTMIDWLEWIYGRKITSGRWGRPWVGL